MKTSDTRQPRMPFPARSLPPVESPTAPPATEPGMAGGPVAVGAPRGAGFFGQFAGDAHDAIEEQTPAGGRLLIYAALAFVSVFIAWACLTHIDEIARGEGKVVPSGSVQVLHSLDGGVVDELMVHEGDTVVRGQPVVRIEAIRADSQRAETVSRQHALDARRSRLQAEAEGRTVVRFEAALQRRAPDAVERETQSFQARQQEYVAQQRVVDGQIAQRAAEIDEYASRRRSAADTLVLLQKEYDASRPLARTGAVSEIDMVRLERELVRTRGEVGSSEAAMVRLEAARTEAADRRRELEQTFRSKARQELSETAGELERLRESVRGLDDRVEKTVLRAPVNGIVKVVHSRSTGGVVQPGGPVLEIVPSDEALFIEARIQPKDIAHLRAGQSATVRISAYDYAVFGGLPATLDSVSPDTVADDKGNAFYLIRVRTKKGDGTHAAVGGSDRPIIAGMTASVDILTGQRTVATYLLKPLMRARQVAFTER
jgi:adhesin transport system membrane fusion protein